jgi:hypothetical protein
MLDDSFDLLLTAIDSILETLFIGEVVSSLFNVGVAENGTSSCSKARSTSSRVVVLRASALPETRIILRVSH